MVLAAFIYWRRRNLRLALVAVPAWVFAYEVLYIGTGTLLHGWKFAAFLWTCTLLGWVVLGWQNGARPAPMWLVAFAVVWLVWVAMGFSANSPGYPWRWSDEVLNVLSKSLLAVAFAVGSRSLVGPARQSTSRPAAAPATLRGASEPAPN